MSAAALSGELEELFRANYQLIYRTAYGVTASRHDAEDVLQTIFLRLLRRGFPPDFGKNPQGYNLPTSRRVGVAAARTAFR